MTLEAAAKAAHADILNPSDAVLRGAASDNREVKAGDLFVAIAGERADGHDFAAAAVKAGAAAVLAERDPFRGAPLAPVLVTENSVQALGRKCVAVCADMTRRQLSPSSVSGHSGSIRQGMRYSNIVPLHEISAPPSPTRAQARPSRAKCSTGICPSMIAVTLNSRDSEASRS